jgi:transposase
MYPRIAVRLTSRQRQRLQRIRDKPATPRIGKRAVCLLLSAEGTSSRLISQVTGLSKDAITDIRRRWNEQGMASVKDAPRPGRPPKVNPAYRQELKDALRRGPLACGYVFTTWSIARLNAHLHRARRTGRRIVVVMDQGTPHHAEALGRYLADVKEHLEVFRLPCYSPELNLIERLWKHLKSSRMANVLSPSFRAFARHINVVLTHFTLHPDFTLSVATPALQTPRCRNILVATQWHLPHPEALKSRSARCAATVDWPSPSCPREN